MARRLLITLGVVVALIVAVTIAGAAYTALKSPLSTKPNSNLTPENCAPGPCVDLQGYTLWVSNVVIDNDVVRMTIKFQNSSPSTHAAPEDLVLIDKKNRSGSLVTDAPSCNTFKRTNFSGGATLGPFAVCFRVTDSTPPFTLHWSPDLGTFCCETNLTIWPS